MSDTKKCDHRDKDRCNVLIQARKHGKTIDNHNDKLRRECDRICIGSFPNKLHDDRCPIIKGYLIEQPTETKDDE